VAIDYERESRPRRALSEEELIADALARDQRRLEATERRSELVHGGSAVVATGLLLAFLPPSGVPSLLSVATALVVLAVASGVRYPIPSGFTVPTVLVAIPVLFVLPPVLLPPVTGAALVLAALPGVLRGTRSWQRLLVAPANAWFTLGPAAVFAVAGVSAPGDAHPTVLTLAVAAMLVADFVPSALRELVVHRTPIRRQVDEVALVYLIDVALSVTGLVVAFSAEERPWTLLLVLPLLILMGLSGSERRARYEQMLELSSAYRGTALVLGDVVEADDAYTGEHTRGVVELALEVADAMGLDATARRNVEFGALLHDVGKVAIPKEIINKAGPLNDAEWEIIRTHTIEGHRMLERVGGIMKDVGLVVRGSHERWDGGGYPDGLIGDQIPLESRIVSACDTWSAMTTSRPYRVAMPWEKAMGELRACSGFQLDPTVVDVLAAVLEVSANRGQAPSIEL